MDSTRPIDIVLARLGDHTKGTGDTGKQWKAICPAHDDHEHSLSVGVTEDEKVLMRCFASCTFAAIAKALGMEQHELFSPTTDDDMRRFVMPGGICGPEEPPRADKAATSVTLAELSADKGIPVEWLKTNCYMGDADAGGVTIPYFADRINDKKLGVKRRTALKAKEGSYWEKGKKLAAYGVWRLPFARECGFLVLVEGECLTGDAEVLTPSGWVRLDQYQGGPVAQWNPDGSMEMVEPLRHVQTTSEHLIKIQNSEFYAAVTPSHKLPAYDRNGRFFVHEAQDRPPGSAWMPRSGCMDGPGIPLTDDEIKLYLAICADGHVIKRKAGFTTARFSMTKARRIERLNGILDRLAIPHHNAVDARGDTRIDFNLPESFPQFLDGKKFPSSWLTEASLRQRNLILDEVILWVLVRRTTSSGRPAAAAPLV
jgi:hypothetical protein